MTEGEKNILIFTCPIRMLWRIGEEKQLNVCRGHENIAGLVILPLEPSLKLSVEWLRTAQHTDLWPSHHARRESLCFTLAQSSFDTETRFPFFRKYGWITVINDDPISFVPGIT